MPTSIIGWSTRKKTRGFSLLELVLCLTIITIFLTFVMVRIDALTGYGDLREAARVLATEIGKRRGEAAYSHTEKLLGFDLERGWIYPIGDDSRIETEEEERHDSGQEEPEGKYRIRKVRALPRGVRFVDLVVYPEKGIVEGEARIRFFPNGCTDEALIHLKNEKEEFYTLEVLSFTGEVVVHNRNVQFEEQKQRLYPVRDHSLPGAHLYSASERL